MSFLSPNTHMYKVKGLNQVLESFFCLERGSGSLKKTFNPLIQVTLLGVITPQPVPPASTAMNPQTLG